MPDEDADEEEEAEEAMKFRKPAETQNKLAETFV